MKEEEGQRTHQKPISCWVWLGVPLGFASKEDAELGSEQCRGRTCVCRAHRWAPGPLSPSEVQGQPHSCSYLRFGRSILWALLAGC